MQVIFERIFGVCGVKHFLNTGIYVFCQKVLMNLLFVVCASCVDFHSKRMNNRDYVKSYFDIGLNICLTRYLVFKCIFNEFYSCFISLLFSLIFF